MNILFSGISGKRPFSVLVFTVIIVMISLIPLVYVRSASGSFELFTPYYFLNSISPVGTGSYIIAKEPSLVFLADIFFGGFKPVLYIKTDGNFLKTIEFSDSLSSVDGYNLFDNASVVLKTNNEGFEQTYSVDGSAILRKGVVVTEDEIVFNFKIPSHVDRINLLFYSDDNITIEDNSLILKRELCEIRFSIDYPKEIDILAETKTIKISNAETDDFYLRIRFVSETCGRQGIYDEPPIRLGPSWAYLFYPMISAIAIGLFWRYYAVK